ncbi:MAG TPA: ATP-binding protein, partial [Acidimicrobiales bacterium]
PGAWVLGDRQGLRQALANLVANAVRLAPSGSHLRVGSGREGDWVWMAVEDEGPGIPTEQRELVFQRFWRGGATGHSDERRSGLGLAIVAQTARDHHGGVGLVASPSGGSIFTVWLPAQEPPAAVAEPVEPAPLHLD